MHAGGPATIRGILYQLLGTLDRALELRIQGVVGPAGKLLDARLIIEPKGGGDLRTETDEVVVEQWKSRRGGGTWSLNELVNEVLPDLTRAAIDVGDGRPTRFRFMTEGRRGEWKGFDAFLMRVQSVAGWEGLDDRTPREPCLEPARTDQALLQTLVERVTSLGSLAKAAPADVRVALWRVLQRFEMPPPVDAEQLLRRVNEHISDLVPRIEELDDARERLIGHLIARVAEEGEVRLTGRALLEGVGLGGASFSDWHRHREKARGLLSGQIAAASGFNESWNVRPPPGWKDRTKVLALTGDSGQGKSWALGALATKLVDQDALVVVVRSGGSPAATIAHADRWLGHDILNHDAPFPLRRFPTRIPPHRKKLPTPWLYLLVDGATVTEAEELHRVQVETGHGVAVAVSLTEPCDIEARWAELHPVCDFEPDELRRYLRTRGLHDLPSEPRIWGLLKRPILAHVYAEIVPEGGEDSEFSLLERFWSERFREIRRRSPSELVALVRAMRLALDEPDRYPWSISTLAECGFSDSNLGRLLRTGWVVSAGHEYRLLHDILFDFALARALSVVDPKYDPAPILGGRNRYPRGAASTFGVFALWLALRGEGASNDRAARLLTELDGYDGLGEYLYCDLLPSLGAGALGAIEVRVRSLAEEDELVLPHVATALAALLDSGPAIEGLVTRLLRSERDVDVSLGLLVCERTPLPRALPRLWEHYCRLSSARHGHDRYLERDVAHRAILEASRADERWLLERLRNGWGQPHAASLVRFLAELESPRVLEFWKKHGPELVRTAHDKDQRRATLRCVRGFPGGYDLDLIAGWSHEEPDLIGEVAEALTRVSPRTFFELLSKCQGPMYRFLRFGGWWMPRLLASEPKRLRKALLEIARADSDALHAFEGHENEMDTATFERLLDVVRVLAMEEIAGGEDDGGTNAGRERTNAGRFLQMATRASRSHHLAALQRRRGRELEAALVSVALLRLASERYDVWFYDQVFQLLVHMGSGRLPEVLAAELACGGRLGRALRWRALRWALVASDEPTIAAVQGLAEQYLEGADALLPGELDAAIVFLSEHGSPKDWVKLVLAGDVYPPVGTIRVLKAPLTDEELSPAIEQATASLDERASLALCVLGDSGRKDCIPLLREALSTRGATANQIAHCAQRGLRVLKASTRDDIERAISLLCRDEPIQEAFSFLWSLPDDIRRGAFIEALRLGAWHPERRETAYRVHDLWVLGGEVGQRVVELVSDRARPWYEVLRGRSLLAMFGDPNLEVAREWLWEDAHLWHRWRHTALAAAEALASWDRDAAIETTLAPLKDATSEVLRSEAAQVLFRIDEQVATRHLLELSPRETDPVVRLTFARLLRRAKGRDLVKSGVSRLVLSGDDADVVAGAQLSAWQGPRFLRDELVAVASGARNTELSQAAWHSVVRQRNEADARRLIRTMQPNDRFAFLAAFEALCSLVDPRLLLERGDALDLRPRLAEARPGIVHFVQERLEQEAKNFESEWKTSQRRMSWVKRMRNR